MSKNIQALSYRKGLENNLFEKIGKASEAGKLNKKEIQRLANEFGIGTANIIGTASFYDFTSSKNKHIKAHTCKGTACIISGGHKIVESHLKQRYTEEEIGAMSCLGHCHDTNAFHLNENKSIQNIFGQPQLFNVDFFKTSLLTAPFPDLLECKKLIKAMMERKPQDILDEIKRSKLRGRGGAGFPVGIKMDSCKNAESDQKFIVCNADEGDPGAYSDRFLLEDRPYSVLLGMLISGYAVGASQGVLYIRAEYPDADRIIRESIIALKKQKLANGAILGSVFEFHFKVIKAQGAYVCGEETALLASIEGRRPEVQARPPYPAIEGLYGKPTLVNNVETLANLFFIFQQGGQYFSEIGTADSTGTKLISVDSIFKKPGLYEVPMGTSLDFFIKEIAGGFKKPVKAVQVGGPLGGIIPKSKFKDLTLDFESFKKQGFMLGHASMVSIPDDFSMLDFLIHLFEFSAEESCGKCFPCRLGTVRGKELLIGARDKKKKIDKILFNDLLDTLEKGSLCGLGGGLPLPIRNALKYFEEELDEYFTTQELQQS